MTSDKRIKRKKNLNQWPLVLSCETKKSVLFHYGFKKWKCIEIHCPHIFENKYKKSKNMLKITIHDVNYGIGILPLNSVITVLPE